MLWKIYRKFQRYTLTAYGYLIFGKRVHVHGFFKVKHPENLTIGDDCSINDGVFILGRGKTTIGNRVTLSANCMILDAGLDVNSSKKEHITQSVAIANDVWIGAGAIILPGVTIGNNAVIGAGSIVTKNVDPYKVVAGNPARVILDRIPHQSNP